MAGFKSVTHHGYQSAKTATGQLGFNGIVVNPYPRGSTADRDFENGVHRFAYGQPWEDPKPVKQVHERY